MKSKLWAAEAWESYLGWHDTDIRIWHKINELIKEIERNPFKGTGHPHPLKADRRRRWSRRITQTDRLVYRVEENILKIFECRGHYDD